MAARECDEGATFVPQAVGGTHGHEPQSGEPPAGSEGWKCDVDDLATRGGGAWAEGEVGFCLKVCQKRLPVACLLWSVTDNNHKSRL